MKKISVWLILSAGIIWGCMGIFVRTLQSYGLTTMQIAAVRLTLAAIVYWIILLGVNPKYAKIKIKDLPILLILGVFSVAGMCVAYFYTISLSTMSTAAVLLYLSPVFVMLMSAIFLKEKITVKKIIALVLAVFGCALVAGVGNGGPVGILAIVTGLISALTYGAYSIIGTKAFEKYNVFTITAYSFTFAAIPVIILCNPAQLVTTISSQLDFQLVLWLLGEGIITADIPFALYTIGLQYTPASKAAILACSEPVAATLCGLIVYREIPSVPAVIGIVLVLSAIILLNINITKNEKEAKE